MSDTNGVEIVNDELFYCPIVGKEIDDGFCYDINAVAIKLVVPDILDEPVNNIEEMTENYCTNCEHCRLCRKFEQRIKKC